MPSVPFEMVEESVTMRALTCSPSPPTRSEAKERGRLREYPGNKIDVLVVARRIVTKQLLNMPSLQ